MLQNPFIATYSLRGSSNGIITWDAPDGNVYTLDPSKAPAGQWTYTDDQYGNHVMEYLPKPPTT